MNEAVAQDWLRAILKVRKTVPEGTLDQYDAITQRYLDSLRQQGIDVSKLDLEV